MTKHFKRNSERWCLLLLSHVCNTKSFFFLFTAVSSPSTVLSLFIHKNSRSSWSNKATWYLNISRMKQLECLLFSFYFWGKKSSNLICSWKLDGLIFLVEGMTGRDNSSLGLQAHYEGKPQIRNHTKVVSFMPWLKIIGAATSRHVLSSRSTEN